MTVRNQRKRAAVLLVEDSPDAVIMAREALAASALVRELHVAVDGEEALQFLRRQGRYGAAPRPHLVLLDLHLPKKNGFEVLREIKKDEALRDIPVIVLSTSEDAADIQACYRLHANCYVVKPIDFDEFSRRLKSIEHFWLTTAALPAAGGT